MEQGTKGMHALDDPTTRLVLLATRRGVGVIQ